MLIYYNVSGSIRRPANISNIMKANCPECKNDIDLTKYPTTKEGMVIECNHCGITLLVKKIEQGTVTTEIIDEGK
jgi:DNA-directed RNA polymerase subunit RPC12/RpoP